VKQSSTFYVILHSCQ